MKAYKRKTDAFYAEKLSPGEHGQTRMIWKEIFPEDTEAYLDDYYAGTALQNEIYVTRADKEIVSALHLNPYDVRMGESKAKAHFIVAVSVLPGYRRQGRMRAMLCDALKDLYEKEEPFTFLTPASEDIYLPFGFYTAAKQAFVTIDQRVYAAGQRMAEEPLYCRLAEEQDLPELSELSRRILAKRCMVCTDRSISYLKHCQREQKAMEGGILLFYRKQRLCGYCFTGEEFGPEIWEAAVLPEDEDAEGIGWEKANRQLADALCRYYAGKLPIRVKGFLPGTKLPYQAHAKEEEKPAAMVRIVHLLSFVKQMRAEGRAELRLAVKDPILPENNGTFCIVFTPEGSSAIRIGEAAGDIFTIEEVTAMFFGAEKYADVLPAGVKAMAPVYFTELA